MFSKATLIGIVGIEPRYKPAANGNDSIITFRIGCKVFSATKEITEWYTIKAFGAVADYLHNNIKKDSSVFLEASIRNRRWIVDGKERQGIEFHAFTARSISTTEDKNPVNTDVPETKTHIANELPFPDLEVNETSGVKRPTRFPRELTHEESKVVTNRFRETFKFRKEEAKQKREAHQTSENNNLCTEIPAVPVVVEQISGAALAQPAKIDSKDKSIFTGNSITDKLLNARNTVKTAKCSSSSFSTDENNSSVNDLLHGGNSVNNDSLAGLNYSQVRGGLSGTH